MTTVRERAIELDDDLPLDTCPGCGSRVPHQRTHSRRTGDAISYEAPRGPVEFSAFCPWTGDMLAARVIRRSIAEGKL